MTDTLITFLMHPFSWGLLVGLGLCFVIWRTSFQRIREQKREIKRLTQELHDLNKHLGQQMKITAAGNDTVTQELEQLRKQNENLRVTVATLQQKPGNAEVRQLQIYDRAVHILLERAPGFAPAWESAVREAEDKVAESESGITRLIRRVARPALGHSHSTTQESSSDR